MIYFNWIVTIMYVLTIVGATVAVLMDNRQPAKTMAWVLVLMFVPVGGLVLYLFFGQNHRKEKYISEKSLDELSVSSMLEFVEQKDLVLPHECKPLIRLFANENMALPFKGRCDEVFTRGKDFFLDLMREIAAAEHHIHISTYIFDDDALGNMIADALIERAKHGVSVRVIYDDVGCWHTANAFFQRMSAAGIEVMPFLPVRFPAFTSKINYRNHRKLSVIDGRVGYIGGMNIALRYIKGTRTQEWKDMHLKLSGNIVYALQRTFMVDWFFVSRQLINQRKYYPTLPPQNDPSGHTAVAQVVTSSPIGQFPTIMQGYVRILLQARHYVYMQTPYFMPTDMVLNAMITAAQSGVDVRLMIPRLSDAQLVEWASSAYLSQVADAGVTVLLFNQAFNHSKMLVADDILCSCGSTNIDFRSFENNCEANVFFYNAPIVQQLKEQFIEDEKECIPYNQEAKRFKQPFLERLWESTVRLLAPLL